MKLDEFVSRFEALGDKAFLENFPDPFLLQEGRILDSGPSQREVYLLRPREERPLTLGRGRHVDLRIQHEHVSTSHAEIQPAQGPGQSWTITDTGSTNGTLLEGTRLKVGAPAELVDRIVLSFGPELRFSFLSPESFLKVLRRLTKGQGSPSSKANFLLKSTDPNLKAIQGLSDEGQVEPGGTPGPELLLLRCEPFDPIPLAPGSKVVVGRSPHVTLVLPNKNVSRKNTQIVRSEDGVFVTDLGSANGTFIGKTRVGARPVELLIGKVLHIGPYELVLEGPTAPLGQTSIVVAARSKGLEGSLKYTSLLDLFQEIESGQLTGLLEVRGRSRDGRVTFRAGEPHSASTSDGEEGTAAIRKLLEVDDGTYLLVNDDPSQVGPRQISHSLSEIALDDFLSSG